MAGSRSSMLWKIAPAARRGPAAGCSRRRGSRRRRAGPWDAAAAAWAARPRAATTAPSRRDNDARRHDILCSSEGRGASRGPGTGGSNAIYVSRCPSCCQAVGRGQGARDNRPHGLHRHADRLRSARRRPPRDLRAHLRHLGLRAALRDHLHRDRRRRHAVPARRLAAFRRRRDVRGGADEPAARHGAALDRGRARQPEQLRDRPRDRPARVLPGRTRAGSTRRRSTRRTRSTRSTAASPSSRRASCRSCAPSRPSSPASRR